MLRLTRGSETEVRFLVFGRDIQRSFPRELFSRHPAKGQRSAHGLEVQRGRPGPFAVSCHPSHVVCL
jgi:hypothetical protein